MSYMKAEEILPIEVIELIQQYADGINIYIPKKENQRAGWGTMNNTKLKNKERDNKIYQEFLEGTSVNELAKKFYLSDKSIWRIIRNMKKTA